MKDLKEQKPWLQPLNRLHICIKPNLSFIEAIAIMVESHVDVCLSQG